MSLRIDTAELIAGSLLIGDTGLGILGSAIPSAGVSGAAYAYNDLSLLADSAKEICGQITTWPADGTLFAYEDTSFEFSGAPDGTYTFTYQLRVDGVVTGSPTTVTLSVGSVSASASGAPASIMLSPATAIGGVAGAVAASGSFAPISISPADAIAAGSAMAQGSFQSIGITAATGSASGTSASGATASGSFAGITLTAATGAAISGTFTRAPAGQGPIALSAAGQRPSNSGGQRL